MKPRAVKPRPSHDPRNVETRVRIGYVGTNLGLGTKTRTFRLAGFTKDRARETARANLADTLRCLEWNAERGIGFFRVTSGIVPFASHPIAADWDWRDELKDEFKAVGDLANAVGMRLGTHPGQYVLINSPRESVVEASLAELDYHADMLDLMGVEDDARLQIHVGGVYDDRESSLRRWGEAHKRLPEKVRRRLAVENDERLFPLGDCLRLNEQVGVPVIFDVFHHSLLNGGETLPEAYAKVIPTWDKCPMQLDYSSQNEDKRFGAHTATLVEDDFREFAKTVPDGTDIMLEIKDKETSAMKALHILNPERGPYIPPPPPEKPKRAKKKAVELVDEAPQGDGGES